MAGKHLIRYSTMACALLALLCVLSAARTIHAGPPAETAAKTLTLESIETTGSPRTQPPVIEGYLGLGPGDSLVSSPENFFDLAGVYPLKMEIVGVLETSDSPDDLAVFTDLKTNWIIMGLGHGH